MDYFIDTNVAIAFSFFPDKFHNSSKELLLERYREIYWSNNVFKEYEEKFGELYGVFEDFLDCILFNLKNNNCIFINKFSFEHFILVKSKYIDLDLEKKINLADIFWEDVILGIFKEECEFLHYFEEYSIYAPKLFEQNYAF